MRRGWVLGVVVAFAATAAGAQTAGGYITGGDLGVSVSVPGGTGGGGSSSSSGGSSGGGATPTCTATSADDTDITGPVSYSPASDALAESLNSSSPGGNILVSKPSPDAVGSWYVQRCGGAVRGFLWVPTGAAPATPPPPPTAAEVFDRIPLPAPSVGISPRADGLTGLSTFVWDPAGAGVATVTATIRGWTATAVAHPDRWQWDMTSAGPHSASNPPGLVTASRPGTEANPAATYRYETRGNYTITMTVRWTGTYTATRPGSAPVTTDLGTASRSSTISYGVSEVRPVLISR